jgi:ethanolamine phosphate transferase 2 subunit G
MIPKQREMDTIVQQIYTAIESQPHLSSCLLVLCGDHGMNDAGNHGGSSPGETSPALVFMSPKLKSISPRIGGDARLHNDFQYYNVVEQSDIAPTLAGLLGFPIPLNNLGVFIPELLALWDSGMFPSLIHATSKETAHARSDAAKLDMMLSNARQIMEVVKQTFPSSLPIKNQGRDRCNPPFANSIDSLVCEWHNVNTIVQTMKISGRGFSEAFAALLVFCRKAQEIMRGTASNYNVTKLQLGIGVASFAMLFASLSSFEILRAFRFEGLVFATMGLSFAGMMMASSYVEEEHQFWYWSLEAWFLLLYIKE